MEKKCCCSTSCRPAPGTGRPWVTGSVTTASGTINLISSQWTTKDTLGALRCRLSGFRMNYSVEPGLYGTGNPTGDSPVFISANYKLSFDHLRRALRGIDAWILVLDTKGINVWCASGKGTFGTQELISRIESSELARLVNHRKCIAPQLGAPGVSAHEVVKATGFSIIFGPVRADDIGNFLKSGMVAESSMRQVNFSIIDRLVLTPMELRPSLEKFIPVTLCCLMLLGLERQGIIFSSLLKDGIPLLVAAFGVLVTGTILTPVLLPCIPFRAFSLKGYLTGFIFIALYLPLSSIRHPLILAFATLFFPAYSSFCALNFTGSTPYTGISGVKKEMKYAVPLYVAVSVIGALLLVAYKLQHLLFSGVIS
jgi:hypothetical protein